MPKGKNKGGFVIVALILAALALPFGILSYVTYFAWDRQQSGEFYKPAFEKDGSLYELNMQGNSLAFDQGTGEDHLYFNTVYHLGDLIALGYNDYEIRKTDNPFFAGLITPANHKYRKQETKFLNPKDSYQAYEFYDRSDHLIFAYEPEIQSEFVVKLRPTFPAFSKSKYSIGNKRDYVDATRLLKSKLNKNLKFRIDAANKLLIFWIEDL